MPVFGGISAAIALAGLGMVAGQAAKAKKDKRRAEADEANAKKAQQGYVTPSSVAEQLADARSKVGAINPALTQAYQQAQLSQANQSAFAQRNASSGAQALSAAADAASNTQSILPTLAGQQTAYDQQNRGMLVQALGASTEDSRIKQQVAQEQNMAAQQYALGRVGAAQQDKSQALGLGIQAVSTAAGIYGAGQQIRNPYGMTPTTKTVNTRGADTTPTNALAPTGTTMPTGATQMPSNLTPLQQSYYRRMGYNFYPNRLY